MSDRSDASSRMWTALSASVTQVHTVMRGLWGRTGGLHSGLDQCWHDKGHLSAIGGHLGQQVVVCVRPPLFVLRLVLRHLHGDDWKAEDGSARRTWNLLLSTAAPPHLGFHAPPSRSFAGSSCSSFWSTPWLRPERIAWRSQAGGRFHDTWVWWSHFHDNKETQQASLHSKGEFHFFYLIWILGSFPLKSEKIWVVVLKLFLTNFT